MKQKTCLDMVMTIVFICLLNTNYTGIKLHEILGIFLFWLFLYHKLLNYKWIKSITQNLFKRHLNKNVKIKYIVDIGLLLLVFLNVITGILISTYIFTGIETRNIATTSNLHHIFAYLLLVLLIVHVGLHWTLVMNSLKVIKHHSKDKIVISIIMLILIGTILGSNTIKKLITPKKSGNSPYHSENLTDNNIQNELLVDAEKPSLKDFLSKMICTGCERHCLLTIPECGRGIKEQQEQVEIFNHENNSNETYYHSKLPQIEEAEEKESNGNVYQNPEIHAEQNIQNELPAENSKPQIEDFLSKLICTACERNCLLVNPKCGRGIEIQQEKVQVYNQTYGTNEVYNSIDSHKSYKHRRYDEKTSR